MYLYGASGHCKVIMDILRAMGEPVEGLFDDNPLVEELGGLPVGHEYAGQQPLIISIGSNKIRKLLSERYDVAYGRAVHPSAIVSPSATIGEGSVVMQGAILQAETRVGRHCIVNTGVSLDHENVLGDYVHVSPHATLCGDVQVGEGTWVGAGTTIIQGVRIGRWCVIGAGSVVSHDVPDGSLAVGNRCRVLKKINQELL